MDQVILPVLANGAGGLDEFICLNVTFGMRAARAAWLRICVVRRMLVPYYAAGTFRAAARFHGYGYGFKLGLYRSPTSLPLV